MIKTVGIDMSITSRNGDRKVMQAMRITNRENEKVESI